MNLSLDGATNSLSCEMDLTHYGTSLVIFPIIVQVVILSSSRSIHFDFESFLLVSHIDWWQIREFWPIKGPTDDEVSLLLN